MNSAYGAGITLLVIVQTLSTQAMFNIDENDDRYNRFRTPTIMNDQKLPWQHQYQQQQPQWIQQQQQQRPWMQQRQNQWPQKSQNGLQSVSSFNNLQDFDNQPHIRTQRIADPQMMQGLQNAMRNRFNSGNNGISDYVPPVLNNGISDYVPPVLNTVRRNPSTVYNPMSQNPFIQSGQTSPVSFDQTVSPPIDFSAVGQSILNYLSTFDATKCEPLKKLTANMNPDRREKVCNILTNVKDLLMESLEEQISQNVLRTVNPSTAAESLSAEMNAQPMDKVYSNLADPRITRNKIRAVPQAPPTVNKTPAATAQAFRTGLVTPLASESFSPYDDDNLPVDLGEDLEKLADTTLANHGLGSQLPNKDQSMILPQTPSLPQGLPIPASSTMAGKPALRRKLTLTR